MVKVTLNLDYPSESKFYQSGIWESICKIILLSMCVSFKVEEVAEREISG